MIFSWVPPQDVANSAGTLGPAVARRRARALAATLAALALLGLLAGTPARAQLAPAPAALDAPAAPGGADPAQADEAERWNLHGQFTTVLQYHPAFHSPYAGANSLDPGGSGKETVDVTLYAGRRLWPGAALYVDPEIDQGFGLSDTYGVAGFPSGEAYKVGARNPYFRLPRLFVRQVWGLDAGRNDSAVDSGPNQLAEGVDADNVTLTVGKYSVVDIFDKNRYANDSKSDFLNWSLLNSGAFDYPADAWAFTYGGALEWTQSWWTLRAGAFALSKVPNSKDIDGTFDQFGVVAEIEERHHLGEHPGKLRLLGFLNRGRMGSYDDALALAQQTDSAPNTMLVRRYASRPGVALNLEQETDTDLGVFARLSYNVGNEEVFEFTEINRSLAVGASAPGRPWRRPGDTAGAALVVNALSGPARDYFADGGYGILIGDGRLNYGLEQIVETYYNAAVLPHCSLSADFQYVLNPAYNRDRGPVLIFGLRLHAQF
jgi:high affinity Mn2+ porin